jgi:hypothetical protein
VPFGAAQAGEKGGIGCVGHAFCISPPGG